MMRCAILLLTVGLANAQDYPDLDLEDFDDTEMLDSSYAYSAYDRNLLGSSGSGSSGSGSYGSSSIGSGSVGSGGETAPAPGGPGTTPAPTTPAPTTPAPTTPAPTTPAPTTPAPTTPAPTTAPATTTTTTAAPVTVSFSTGLGGFTVTQFSNPTAQSAFKTVLVTNLNITGLQTSHVTISNIRAKTTSRRVLATASGVEFEVAIDVDALSSGSTLSATQVAQQADQVKTSIATFRTKLQADTSFVTKFKNDLKTEFATQSVTFDTTAFENFDMGSVTTVATVAGVVTTTTAPPGKKKDKKVLYIGVGAGVGGLVLLGILFGVCRQRKTLEKIDPNMQQDGVVAGQVVPGAGQPMLQQEV